MSIRNFSLKAVLMVLLLVLSGLFTGCFTSTEEGKVQVQVVRGEFQKIIRPTDGWYGTWDTFGDSYYEVDLRTGQLPIEINASTGDNAAVMLKIQLAAHLLQDDDSIKAHLRKFGLEPEERKPRLVQMVTGVVNTEVKNAISGIPAYELLAKQTTIQQAVLDAVGPKLKSQAQLEIESVQIIGRPDFADDRIEQAASGVVANQKLQEAAQAALAADKIEAERKELAARAYANPALLALEKLRLELEIEKARAEGIKGHSGPLTIVNGSTPLQLRTGQ